MIDADHKHWVAVRLQEVFGVDDEQAIALAHEFMPEEAYTRLAELEGLMPEMIDALKNVHRHFGLCLGTMSDVERTYAKVRAALGKAGVTL